MNGNSYYTKHDDGVAVYHEGKSFAASSAHPMWSEITKALDKKDIAKAAELIDIKGILRAAAAGFDRLMFKDGNLVYKELGTGKEHPLEGALIDRVVAGIKSGKMTTTQMRPLMLLLDNIMKNELKFVRDEMYLFLAAGDMPITQDGCFLAYKKVGSNFKDLYTGTLDNSPGKVVAMDPNKVDRDRNTTCSTGLHFAARSYLKHYAFGGRHKTVVVKVNPRNVFAIPSDYSNAKGRASEYFVVGEIKGNKDQDAFLEAFIFDENKAQVAPSVKFIDGGLKASLLQLAEGYGLALDGKAMVRVANSKGTLSADKYVVVKEVSTDTFVDALTGKSVSADQVKMLSVTTKSVRSALVRAVAKARKALR
jgi:hypothetical protein